MTVDHMLYERCSWLKSPYYIQHILQCIHVKERIMTRRKKNPAELMRIAKIIDKKVYTEQEGKYLGKVSRVTFNRKSKKLTSLVIKESVWTRKYYQLLTKEIRSIGEDVIYISSIEKCIDLKGNQPVDEMSFQNIDDHRTVTDEGKLIGVIDDIAVSLDNFSIKELIFKDHSYIKVDPSKITLGQDEIIIPKELEEQVARRSKMNIFKKYINFAHDEILPDVGIIPQTDTQKQKEAMEENL
jgi:uncharacterized protein YrrD